MKATRGQILFLAALLLFLGLFLIYPLAYILVSSVVVDGRFTLAFFGMLISDQAQWVAFLNSTNLGLMVTLATTVISIPLAYIMVRREFRGKGALSALILAPLVLPPFVGAVGMRQMFARFGSINLLLMETGIIDQPIDWFGGSGMTGVVVLEVLHLYPIMYLNVAAALANIDPSLEEAARNAGARGFTLFRRIVFPLFLPGYFAGASIVFIWAFTDLGVPLIFDYRQVVPIQIFDMLTQLHENPSGYTLVVVMIAMAMGLFYVTKSVIGGNRFEMMARGHVGSSIKRASKTETVLIYGFILTVSATALIPHLSVIITSFSDRWVMTVLPEAYTTRFYGMLLEHQLTASSIRNSIMLSGLSTVLDVIIGVSIAFLLVRTRIPGKSIIDTLTMLPLAVPGIIIAFGYVAAFSGTWLDPRDNPVPLLIIAYAVRRLPYMVRSAYAGFQQINVNLEEAARNVGAGAVATLRRITLPLIYSHILAGGLLCFSFAMLEVADSIILAFEEKYYPITKAIFTLLGRPDGAYIGCALGTMGMLLLMISLFLAHRFLGRKLGEIFRI
jgi:iron(III) transport system permease protein